MAKYGLTDEQYAEFVKMMEGIEHERKVNPCCYNCSNYYTEYGCDMCKQWGQTLENMNDKCSEWR